MKSSSAVNCLVVFVGLLTSSLAGCTPTGSGAPRPGEAPASQDSAAEPLPRAACVKPVRKDLVRKTEQPGQIEAFEVTPLFSRVTGFINKIHVDIGDRVTGPKDVAANGLKEAGKTPSSEGQILAELAVPELEAELRQKQALVAQVHAEVKQAKAAVKVAAAAQLSAQAQIVQTRAMLERDEAQYNRWKSELSRLRELAASGSVTRKLVEETDSQFLAADAARHETAARIKSVEAKAAESDALLEKARADSEAVAARLNVANADEQRTQAMLNYAMIRAPFDGVVSARNVHNGHLVQAAPGGGLPLLVVTRTDIVRIFVDVPEVDAALLTDGSNSRIRVPALGDAKLIGTVKRTAWVLSPATRTLRAEIDVENRGGRLRPGMYAYAELNVAERSQVLTLPRGAIQKDEQDEAFCLGVGPDGLVTRIPVSTGLRAGEEVEVISGLKGEEQIIVTNLASFRPSQRVKAVAPAAKSSH